MDLDQETTSVKDKDQSHRQSERGKDTRPAGIEVELGGEKVLVRQQTVPTGIRFPSRLIGRLIG